MQLKKFMQDKNIDFTILFSLDSTNYDKNFFYYSKYKCVGCYIIPKQKKPFTIVVEMDSLKVKGEKFVFRKGDFFKFIKETLKKKKIKSNKIGIDFSSVNLLLHNTLKKNFKGKYTDVSESIIQDRIIKSDFEIKLLKKSSLIATKILDKCLLNFKKFKTEQDVKTFLLFETKKFDCSLAFEPTVASGKGSSIPHYEESKKLSKGFCVLDFGVSYKGYLSDISRTIYLGKPSKEDINYYDTLLKIQQDTIKKIKIGLNASKLEKYARKELGSNEKYFIHALGHGIGIKTHEMPRISKHSKDILKKGMFFTIEPGIYFPNKFGIRIEDTIYLGKKVEVLTRVKKKLLVFN